METLAKLILVLGLLSPFSQPALQPAILQTNRLKLYRTNTNMRLDQQFLISFQKAYTSAPIFVYGISQYYLGAVHSYENLSNFLSALSSKQATLNVTSFGITNRLWLAISYLAIQKNSQFGCDSVQNGYISKAANGTHYSQTEVTISSMPSLGGNYSCIGLLRGFYWNHSTTAKEFGFVITVQVTSNKTYNYTIQAPANFTAQNIAFDVLFFPTLLSSPTSQLSAQMLNYQINSNSQQVLFNQLLFPCSQTLFLVGLNGFMAQKGLANRELTWDISCSTNSSNSSLSLSVSNWKSVYLCLLQISTSFTVQVITNQTNNTEKNSSTTGNSKQISQIGSKGSSLTIYALVLGLVGGIILLIIVVVVLKKYNCCKKLPRKREMLSNENLRSFPTISL